MPTRSIAMRRSSGADCTSGIGISNCGRSGLFIASANVSSPPGRQDPEAYQNGGPRSCGGLREHLARPCAEALANRSRDALGVEPAFGEKCRRVAVIDEAIGQAQMKHRQ